jgi:predicted Zn-dependent protease
MAEKLLMPLLKKYKKDPYILDTRAWICYKQGKFKEARNFILRLEKEERDIPEINFHLGMIYLKLGEKIKAREYLKMAINSKGLFIGREKAKKALMSL